VAADVVGDAGDHTGSGGGRLRLGSVWALVWLGPRWSAARDSAGSDVAKRSYRLVCIRKNPHGFRGDPGVLDGLPQRERWLDKVSPPMRMDSGWTTIPTMRFVGSIRSTRGKKGATLKRTTGAARLRSRPAWRQTPSRRRRGWGCLRCPVTSASARASTCAGRSSVTQAWTTPPVRQQTRGGGLTRPRVAEWGLGGAAGVAGVSERPCVRAQEWACELKNDPALAPRGGKTPRRATPRLTVVKRRRARFGRGN
jgi:hypothetical protein